jgi:hypothetical protein
MQRRVAAIYFAFFLVLGASAYSVIAMAEEPAIDVEGETYAASDNVTVEGLTYEVADVTQSNASEGEGMVTTANITYTNSSAVYSAELANGSALSPTNSSWPGRAAAYTATLNNGDSVQFNGSQQTVNVSGGEFALVNASGNETATFAVGDSFRYQSNATTVTEVGNTSATLTWGDNYGVVIANVSDPDEFQLVQQFNVSQRLSADPAVENRTYAGENNETFVRYRNGTTQPLDAYLPARDRATFAEGDSLTYRPVEDLTVPANETTVENVSTDRVLLEWEGPKTTRTTLTEGANATLGPAGQEQTFTAHFPDGATLQLVPDTEAYLQEVETQDYYQERINGLWGISILSAFAGIFIVGLAYLPHKD